MVHGVRDLVPPPGHEISAEPFGPAVPEYDILQTGPSAPMCDRVTQHNTKGSEGELFVGVDVILPNEGAPVIDHCYVCMVRLSPGRPEEVGVRDNGT